MSTIRISEIFGPTIQGEGALIGEPTVFVRTGGCDYRCSWCDTLYAVESKYRHDWKAMSAEDIMQEVERLSGEKPLTISLSGGNPATQNCKSLIDLGHQKGYRFALETQGSVTQDWFADLDVLTLSPKPPSSGMDTDIDLLKDCIKKATQNTEIALKIVVFDEIDFIYAQNMATEFPDLDLYLQAGNHTPPQGDDSEVDMDGILERNRWLVDKVVEEQWYKAKVLPQLHVLLWGNLRGV